ncbi:2-hydroxyacyl-CoA dehydratase family protein [Cuneatibacter sp. NSJ-177]|uniref:2-hydroxyacyl-CoA dehydratase family protein n=1 Tax=Cuneatibacter sp. NSJ-177 TaxID=2931401 RepID=UPI001FD27A2E|nr:2-hydroxyacyl-CoA dehydratase family protein [Cuneatibacter sp. NSJ-177]MCJ7836344.1 2-hydroxyacyl-CoA dehydratase family protein [Cuneatibacter sp. NSJ-177]
MEHNRAALNGAASFLKACDFSEEEILAWSAVLEEACRPFGLCGEDLRRAAEEILPSHYDMGLEGIRLLIGAYVREFLNLYRKSPAYRIYTTVPAPIPALLAVQEAGGDSVLVCSADYLLMVVLRGFLGWEGPGDVIGSPCCRHCGLNELRIYSAESGLLPDPDLMWNWGMLCDESGKSNEWLNLRLQSWPLASVILPKTAAEEPEARRAYMAAEIGDTLREVGKKAGIEIGEEAKERAWKKWERLSFAVESLNHWNCTHIQLGGNENALVQALFLAGFSDWEPALHSLQILRKELQERERLNPGKNKPSCRIGCFLLPFLVPEVSDLFEANGVRLLTSTAVMARKDGGCRTGSFEEKVASFWMRAGIASTMEEEAEMIGDYLIRYQLDAYLIGMFSFDRWMGAHQKLLARRIQERTGKKTLFLELDFWGKDIELGRLETQIETFSAMLKSETIK